MATYRFGRCLLDTEAQELRVDGAEVRLEPQVFNVLSYLLEHRTRMVSKNELLDSVWGSQFVSESALTSRIKSARRAIGDDGSSQGLIRTQRGAGYRFVGEVQVVDDEPVARSESQWRATGSLPASRVPLIGRVDDLVALRRLLSDQRTVTISGPGGVGKSTLALELARECAETQGLGVAFVELAPVRQRADIVRAVAEATGVEGMGAADIGMLAATLSARGLLLVLDNCEHLLDASAELVNALLDAGPGVRVLTTSREPLGIDGEAVFVLGSLGSDAATLFVERAASATGRISMVAGDRDVIELCERLDGLPLAIELAAAQMRHLTLDELIGKLDHRLKILVGGRPRAGERHATLMTTIEWSYQLLSDSSRDMFDRLGVFPATFDLAAVQAVCAGLDLAAVTNAIGDLVGKNLVVHDRGRRRYRLLETIRLFAAHRLEASGQSVEITERLRAHVVARVTEKTRSQAWLSASLAARQRDDIENVRLAFDASIARGRFADAVDIMLGLSSLWRNAVSYGEGLRWAASLTSHDLAPRDQLWLHLVEADLGLGSGDPRLMANAAAAAADLASGVHDPAAAVIAGIYRALSAIIEPEQSVAGLSAAAEQAREIGEVELQRVARAFRVVALLAAGRRSQIADEIGELTGPASDGYDRYISFWAAWVIAVADRDGPRLRRWMDIQLENVRRSGLEENWMMMFSQTLTAIGAGADYLPHLGRTRRRAEAEGRNADIDCVLALAYAAACQDDLVTAAELIGASGGRLFHDTANFVHYLIIRDCVVRPNLDAAHFDEAVARGGGFDIAAILSEHHL